MLTNDFSKLDAQSEVSRLAHVGPFEQDPAEFDSWQVFAASPKLVSDASVEQDLARTIYWGARPALTI